MAVKLQKMCETSVVLVSSKDVPKMERTESFVTHWVKVLMHLSLIVFQPVQLILATDAQNNKGVRA